MSDQRRITQSKTIRLTEEELKHIHQLLPHFPEVSTEAELLGLAALLGIWVLAARTPDFVGYELGTLAGLLGYRLLRAIDLVVQQGTLPVLQQLLELSPTPAPEPYATAPED